MIDHDVDPLVLRGGIGVLQGLQQVPKQPSGFARPLTVVQRAGGQIKAPGQVVLRIGPGRSYDLHWGALRHFPRVAHLGQQVTMRTS